jgi:hypothetical protein
MLFGRVSFVRRLARWVVEPAGLTLAVTLATLPVVLSVFQSVSLVSPLAHILAVPLLAPVLVGAALLAVVAPIQPLGVLVGWLTWLPTAGLVEIIRITGSLPGAALSTGRPPPLAIASLAVAVLAWGCLGLPEAAPVRHAWQGYRARYPACWTPLVCLAGGLAAIGLVQTVRPDGRLHVETLAAGRGDAVFIRGPTGRTALLVGGRMNGGLVASQVAAHLAPWEHQLGSVVCLDPAADAGLSLTLARYSPVQRLDTAADGDARVDLGGGAALDIYASDAASGAGVTLGQPAASASISFGQVWLPLVGRPPPPISGDTLDINRLVSDGLSKPLVSDGTAVWAADDDATESPALF